VIFFIVAIQSAALVCGGLPVLRLVLACGSRSRASWRRGGIIFFRWCVAVSPWCGWGWGVFGVSGSLILYFAVQSGQCAVI
jgi:hypothetical protein